jgi:hypothetical protein
VKLVFILECELVLQLESFLESISIFFFLIETLSDKKHLQKCMMSEHIGLPL